VRLDADFRAHAESPSCPAVPLDVGSQVEQMAGCQLAATDDCSAQEPDDSPGQHCDCRDAVLEVPEQVHCRVAHCWVWHCRDVRYWAAHYQDVHSPVEHCRAVHCRDVRYLDGHCCSANLAHGRAVRLRSILGAGHSYRVYCCRVRLSVADCCSRGRFDAVPDCLERWVGVRLLLDPARRAGSDFQDAELLRRGVPHLPGDCSPVLQDDYPLPDDCC